MSTQTATQKKWTVNSIKDSMRSAGSHWFDPDTMRFFGTKVESTVYQGDGGVFFVTSEQPPHGQRGWTVRRFDAVLSKISTIGELAGHSKEDAHTIASNHACGKDGPVERSNEFFQEVSVLEQFVADCDKHSSDPSKVTVKDCKTLITNAKRHYRLMEQLCGDEEFCRGIREDGSHPQVDDCRQRTLQTAKRLGAKDVVFSGDPRDCTVRLVWADGATNDFAGEGWIVPIDE